MKKERIEDFCCVCDQAFETLLDCYQMWNWKMTWDEFLDQFEKELKEEMVHWRKSFKDEEDE